MAVLRLSPEERRRAIVDAAMPLFAEKGFAGTTTRDLAAAAGVSEALLYRHFPSKEALYQEILRVARAEVDPLFKRLRELEPSTSSLVHIVFLLAHRLVTAPAWGDVGWETRHRLLTRSHLEDGQFARLVFQLIGQSALVVFEANLQAAEAAGDLVPSPVKHANRFWFLHQLTAAIAVAGLAKTGMPYQTGVRELVKEVVWFLLRGIGLKDEAIKTHYNPEALALLVT